MIYARLLLTRCAVVAALCAALTPAASVAAGSGGLSSAQLQRLHRLNLPVIAPSALPAGFHVTKAEALPGGRSYRIVYVKGDASITFEVGQLSGAVAAAATPAPKRGFLQRMFGSASKIARGPSAAATPSSATAGETEGQGTTAIVADSRLIGPVRFTPTGQCLQGTADSTKAQVHGVQVRVSGCNFDDPDTLIGAYKSAHRY